MNANIIKIQNPKQFNLKGNSSKFIKKKNKGNMIFYILWKGLVIFKNFVKRLRNFRKNLHVIMPYIMKTFNYVLMDNFCPCFKGSLLKDLGH